MHPSNFIYSFVCNNTETELCKLESKYLFNKDLNNKILLSNRAIAPSSSAFIKNRLEIISSSKDYATLITQIKKERICMEDFKVEYLVFDGDHTEYDKRLEKLKDIGYSIKGNPDYYKPKTTYALCYYEQTWYFGLQIKNKYAWQKHNKKPRSYSNSIGINIAKSLVNIAARGNKDCKLLDACCGVGTIMLEACFAGHDIEGCDINWKHCRDSRVNLAHFEYSAEVFRSDIKDISKQYDAAILDLPYNLLSTASEDDILHIIKSATAIANRMFIVSITDIAEFINIAGLKIIDQCSVSKPGKTTFTRKIWICEKKR